MTAPLVIHDENSSRYEIVVDGESCGQLEYVLDGDVITFTHTHTKPAMRGRGLAAVIVGTALDDARAAGRRVIAECWYVRQFIARHPDYADLLDERARGLR